ncbi:putative P-loop containing nucleoside triphosphate hydrolase [Helianthus annuus]|nr:putative P-loop containing nucleoside triphosphate hydrolase [Helianthus annuus]
MAIHDKVINSWLEQCNLEFLAIYGMGGSGKTTLAKYIYNLYQKSFEYVSFVEDIGTGCEKPNGLLKLQQQLLNDILGGKKRKIPGVSRGTCIIAKALEMKKALIVLDNIVEPTQLFALLGTGTIHAQSKIIITTRENTDSWFDKYCWRCEKYEMKLLDDDDESSELLCRHAFGSKLPMPGFEELVLQAIQYCEGNPLSLEVLGSSLLKSSIENWASQLRLLERDIDSRVQGVLIRSYESLPCDTVKGLFLHIACFFKGIDKGYVEKILEPDYSAISGIKILLNRCLLSVSSNKKLMMHRLIQEMGKNIVRQESPKFPAKRSRVWLSSDSYKILSQQMGSEMVEGLALDMKMLIKENFALKSSDLKTEALKNMDRLKLLQLKFVELNGSYENFSEDLRWLCWLGFHLKMLVHLSKLDETELGHMKWLQEYKEDEVCLVGDDELTVGRSWHIQMLYEFNIMSTSLPDIKDPNMTPMYISESSSLSFDVPSCPKNKRLKGINVIVKYATQGDDWAWFCKVSTTNGVVNLMYNPTVFGKPGVGEVCMWLSYWPVGNSLNTGDTVNVSIVVISGLEVHECGVSLVYSDQETLETNMGWAEIVGVDLTEFELSTGAYYLCQRDFFSLMEVGRLTPDWFRILVGDTIDYTEVRGWRKTGRPKQVNGPSFTEIKTVRCINLMVLNWTFTRLQRFPNHLLVTKCCHSHQAWLSGKQLIRQWRKFMSSRTRLAMSLILTQMKEERYRRKKGASSSIGSMCQPWWLRKQQSSLKWELPKALRIRIKSIQEVIRLLMVFILMSS